MEVTIESSVKEKVESVRLGCLVYDVKVKEKNEELWEKLENEIFPLSNKYSGGYKQFNIFGNRFFSWFL